MNVIACIKRVPDVSEVDVEIEPSGKEIKKERLTFIINECDNYSLEEAIRIKERFGGSVTAITVGSREDEEILRRALAMGADKAIRVDFDLKGDSYTIARVLSEVIRGEKYDLIFFGALSGDFGCGQVGAYVAKILGINCVTFVKRIEYLSGFIKAYRELEGGLEEAYDVKLPAVVTIQTGINEPRYVSIMGIRRARAREIKVLTLQDLGLKDIDIAPKVKLERLYLPPPVKAAELIAGTLEEIAMKLVALLKGKGVI